MPSGGFNVTQTIEQYTRSLDDLQRRQVPYVAAVSLTRMAQYAKKSQRRAIIKTFDRPTPFTKNSLGVMMARKADFHTAQGPWSACFVKDKQAMYLSIEVTGGIRHALRSLIMALPNKKAAGVAGLNFNQYGNLPRNRLRRITSGRRDVFVTKAGTPQVRHLKPGIYARPAHKKGGVRKKKQEATGLKKIAQKFLAKKKKRGGVRKRRSSGKPRAKRGSGSSSSADRLRVLASFRPQFRYSSRYQFVYVSEMATQRKFKQIVGAELSLALRKAFK